MTLLKGRFVVKLSQLFVCTANDTIGGNLLTLCESYTLESRHNS